MSEEGCAIGGAGHLFQGPIKIRKEQEGHVPRPSPPWHTCSAQPSTNSVQWGLRTLKGLKADPVVTLNCLIQNRNFQRLHSTK